MLGTLIRHALSCWTRGYHPPLLPVATLIVNLAGCFAIGWLYKWSMEKELVGTWLELGLRVGVLGGLTTFSTFGLDIVNLWQSRPGLAVSLALAHVVLGLAAVVLGMTVRG